MSEEVPVFDPLKEHTYVSSMDPDNQVVFVQFGAQFDSAHNFLGYEDGYEEAVHSESAVEASRKEPEPEVTVRTTDGIIGKDIPAPQKKTRGRKKKAETKDPDLARAEAAAAEFSADAAKAAEDAA